MSNFRTHVCMLTARSHTWSHLQTHLLRGHAEVHITGRFCSQTIWAVIACMVGACMYRSGNGIWTVFKVFYCLVLNFRFCACLARFPEEYCHPNSTHFCLHQNQGNRQHLLHAVNYMYRENCRLCRLMACTWISVVKTKEIKETKANPS